MFMERSHPQRTALAALTDAWLAQGVTGYSILIEGKPVLSWPPHAPVSDPELVAPIYRAGKVAGEIRATGQHGQAAQARFDADAQLIGLLLDAEADLAALTDVLVETQDQLLAVYDLAQVARGRVAIGETLEALAGAAARLLDTEGMAIALAPEGKQPLVAQQPAGSQRQGWLLGLLPILRARQQVVLWQGPDLPERLPGNLCSLLMLPVYIAGQIQGGLIFWSGRAERFTSPDIKLAGAVAEHAGAQIENALLHQDRIAQAGFETEMALARRVQTNLLPKAPPRLPGLALYASTRPASQVGGDYFDFVAGPNGSTTLVVADVSGKGLSSALVMGMIRTSLRSIAGHAQKTTGPLSSPGPSELLARINEELYDDLTELSMFATVFAAQYQPENRSLVYANAGHSPVIYKPARGPAGLLEADSPPIGVLPSRDCAERRLDFGPGDLLIAASDGLNEASNRFGQLFGIERLLAYVDANAQRRAEPLGQGLLAAIQTYSEGETQQDDQTLVIAQGTPA